MKKLVSKLNSFGNSFNAFEANILRMMLGVFLFYKGVDFLQSTDVIVELVNPVKYNPFFLLISHYIILAHIAGGILIFAGLLTRIAAIMQVPILVVAVIAHSAQGSAGDIILASTVLLLLVFYTIIGSGRLSVDYTLKLHV